MNPLDITVLAVIALSALFAFARGLVREALSIIAWAGAAVTTFYFFARVYAVALRYLTTPLLADLAAGAGLFLGSLIVLTVITSLIARRVHYGAMSSIDRTLGLIFGLFRGVVVVSLAYLLVDISVPPTDRPGWVKQARSTPLLAQGANIVRDVLPPSLRVNAASAEDNQQALEKAKEYERAMHALTTPAGPAPGKSGQTPAPDYKPGGRQQLNRLIDNTR